MMEDVHGRNESRGKVMDVCRRRDQSWVMEHRGGGRGSCQSSRSGREIAGQSGVRTGQGQLVGVSGRQVAPAPFGWRTGGLLGPFAHAGREDEGRSHYRARRQREMSPCLRPAPGKMPQYLRRAGRRKAGPRSQTGAPAGGAREQRTGVIGNEGRRIHKVI